MGIYLIVEGLDGSGSSYAIEKLVKQFSFIVLTTKEFEPYWEDKGKWWECGEKYILKRFRHYIDVNAKEIKKAKLLLRQHNVLQLKSPLSTLVTHAYFLKRMHKDLHDIISHEINYIHDYMVVIFADNKTREKRFTDRKASGKLTDFDVMTLSEEYVSFWMKIMGNAKEITKRDALFLNSGESSILSGEYGRVFEKMCKDISLNTAMVE